MSDIALVGGYIPSPPDDRDYPLSKVVPYGATSAQPYVIPYEAPIEDQGNTMMCVDYALRGATIESEYQQRGAVLDLAHGYIFCSRKTTDFQGEGLILREALTAATRLGIPRRAQFDFIGKYADGRDLITKAIDGDGLPTRMRGFVTLRNIVELYTFLTRFKYSAIIGLTLYESFLNTGPDGIIPPPSGAILGGHGMRASGIVLKNNKLMVRLPNSWGTHRGDNGFYYLDLSEHILWEMWGPIYEETGAIVDRPREGMLTLGSKTMIVGDKLVTLPFAPFIEKNSQSAAVPLRAIAEALGVKIEWYANGGRIVFRDGGEYVSIDKVT